MGNIHLVTGYAGQEHVTAADQGAFNAALLGSGQFVFDKGNKFSASVVTNNQIRVLDGDIYMQGRHIRLNEGNYVDLTIENGTQGFLRNDLIVARYMKNGSTGIEECNIVVIKGENATSSPADPSYTIGDILSGGAALNDMPLYRVPLIGLAVGDLVPLFSTQSVSIPALYETKQEKTDSLDDGGELSDSDSFPFYDASSRVNKKARWLNIKTALGKLFAPKDHSHSVSASDIKSGILGVGMGGTGVDTLDGLAAALRSARIELVSYVGTGESGPDHPCSITSTFAPKVVFYLGWSSANAGYGNTFRAYSDGGYNAATQWIQLPDMLATTYAKNCGFACCDNTDAMSYVYGKKSDDGKTMYWYNSPPDGAGYNPADAQLNNGGYTYYFLLVNF